MIGDLPDNIRKEVRELALPLRSSLLGKGWHIGPVRWRDEDLRIVWFLAVPPGEKSITVECPENQLAEKFHAYLSN